jgi:hypothetical protein
MPAMPKVASEKTIRILVTVLNGVAVAVCAYLALSMYRQAGSYFESVGGMPTPSIAWLRAFATSPDVVQRLQAYAYAWVLGVLSVGTAVVCIAGIRQVAFSAMAILATRR